MSDSGKKARVYFRDTNHRPLLVSVDDEYQINFSPDGQWLVLPSARVRADDILTVQIVTESRELKAA